MLKENRLIEKCVGERRRRKRRLICVDKDVKTNEHKLPVMQMCVMMLMEGGRSVYVLYCHCNLVKCDGNFQPVLLEYIKRSFHPNNYNMDILFSYL